MVTVDEAKKLTVPKIKKELEKLGLDQEGLKPVLLARLIEAIEAPAPAPEPAPAPAPAARGGRKRKASEEEEEAAPAEAEPPPKLSKKEASAADSPLTLSSGRF